MKFIEVKENGETIEEYFGDHVLLSKEDLLSILKTIRDINTTISNLQLSNQNINILLPTNYTTELLNRLSY